MESTCIDLLPLGLGVSQVCGRYTKTCSCLIAKSERPPSFSFLFVHFIYLHSNYQPMLIRYAFTNLFTNHMLLSLWHENCVMSIFSVFLLSNNSKVLEY